MRGRRASGRVGVAERRSRCRGRRGTPARPTVARAVELVAHGGDGGGRRADPGEARAPRRRARRRRSRRGTRSRDGRRRRRAARAAARIASTFRYDSRAGAGPIAHGAVGGEHVRRAARRPRSTPRPPPGPASRQARAMRMAISPRLAIRTVGTAAVTCGRRRARLAGSARSAPPRGPSPSASRVSSGIEDAVVPQARRRVVRAALGLVLLAHGGRRERLRLRVGAASSPRAASCCRFTVSSVCAACSPPMTEMRLFGHENRSRGRVGAAAHAVVARRRATRRPAP